MTACTALKKVDKKNNKSAINLAHFQHLYKEIKVGDKEMGIIHIYSEYPDYRYEIEPKEGFTCVDDVARAIILLAELNQSEYGTKQSYEQLKKLLEFVLHMQNENGYFNNFIWHDYSINETYKTSVAELNWWSLRAFWALEKAYPLIKKEKAFADRVDGAVHRLLENIIRDLPTTKLATKESFGMKIPTYLPQKYAGDQAAILMLSLLANYQRTGNEALEPLIYTQANGLLLLQRGTATTFPYGAFMSWDNLWHAWGNSQAYALLKVGHFFKEQKYIDAALKEVEHFYPYLLKNGFAEAFWISKESGQILETKRNRFPQIAYGIRPMVWASIEAYKITKKQKYLKQAKQLTNWLLGSNVLGVNMYDATTGRCYDGIISADKLNKNSGAESTIECLLSLIKTASFKH
jgi:hypothetical protein